MDLGLELSPVPAGERRAGLVDVLLLYAGANIVTTTLVTGGSLAPAFSLPGAVAIVALGVLLGTAVIALLARLGPRFGLPSMVLLRQPFGVRGAGLISLLLVVTNFAWIALNNVIAGRALAQLAGGSEIAWNLAVGALAVGIALTGPRAMARFDRLAVPLMLLVGAALTVALLGKPALWRQPGDGSLPLLAGLDLVVGYQISWSLMFADYTRYQKREGAAAGAVMLGLGLTSLWLMVVGAGAGMAGGGNDPTSMILGLGLPVAALLLMALSTVTTNFVNLYLSSLALRNLAPRLPPRATVLGIGTIGTLLGLVSSNLLDRFGSFMALLATLLLPVVAIAAVHFFGGGRSKALLTAPAWRPSALIAWAMGAAAYQLMATTAWGATVPSLVVAGAAYAFFRRGAAPQLAGPS